ncbi:related to bZIP transcription factor [Cephalotrichum gorgonifer]|uniref:Related to bZIP transcription factor n=1 Tax=Cephalotrichum gorgonifer TaxID=2041049 RepID=A0AAE8MND0_9PEZI|nr:related to bZIP transcription factor [Cephalotrichum gorgonifer]
MATPTTHVSAPPAVPPPPRQRTSSTTSSTEQELAPRILAPVPTRPRLLSRKSSGPMVISRESDVGPVDIQFGPDDVRAMSPRRASDDIEAMGREAREELRRQAKLLQESLLNMFQRIESVREEHDKLDSNNRFLQKYIGDLMSTSKITATDGSRAKNTETKARRADYVDDDDVFRPNGYTNHDYTTIP